MCGVILFGLLSVVNLMGIPFLHNAILTHLSRPYQADTALYMVASTTFAFFAITQCLLFLGAQSICKRRQA